MSTENAPDEPLSEDEAKLKAELEAHLDALDETWRKFDGLLFETMGLSVSLMATLPIGSDWRRHMVAVSRVLAALRVALVEEEEGPIPEMAKVARSYLRSKSDQDMLGGLVGAHLLGLGSLPASYLDIEPPRHLALSAMKQQFLEDLEKSAKEEGRDPAIFLASKFLMVMRNPSELQEVIAGLEVPEGTDPILLVIETLRASLQRIDRSSWAKEETAERLIVEIFLGLGVRESVARGLFRYEDQRQKRGNTPPAGQGRRIRLAPKKPPEKK